MIDITADLAILNAAIVSGAQRVRFADGREVTYRTMTELFLARADLIARGSAGVSTGVYPVYGKGT